MEQGRDDGEPDAQGRVEGPGRGVEGRQRARRRAVRREESESGLGRVETVEGLGRGGFQELTETYPPQTPTVVMKHDAGQLGGRLRILRDIQTGGKGITGISFQGGHGKVHLDAQNKNQTISIPLFVHLPNPPTPAYLYTHHHIPNPFPSRPFLQEDLQCT